MPSWIRTELLNVFSGKLIYKSQVVVFFRLMRWWVTPITRNDRCPKSGVDLHAFCVASRDLSVDSYRLKSKDLQEQITVGVLAEKFGLQAGNKLWCLVLEDVRTSLWLFDSFKVMPSFTQFTHSILLRDKPTKHKLRLKHTQ